ncbi:transposase [Streptomyces fructofermentans]|uniref:transposase n=1 Tax=Streptomyces fructofermentans TaxID=152141 RepID=UPI0033F848C0
MGACRAVAPARKGGPEGGRRENCPRRRIVDEVLYVVRTEGAGRQLPTAFAPWFTVYWSFARWHDGGTVERIHDALRGRIREAGGRGAGGRGAAPSRGLIDSQVVHAVDTLGTTRGSCG